MKSLMILLLIFATISNIKSGDFSIDTFLNYLEEKGLFSLLAEIKYSFGDDISIAFCKELIKSPHCETVIRVYMPARARQINPGEENIEKIAQVIDNYKTILFKAGFLYSEIERVKNLMMKF